MTDVTMQLWYNYWERPKIFFPKTSTPHSGVSSLLFNRYWGFTQKHNCRCAMPTISKHPLTLQHRLAKNTFQNSERLVTLYNLVANLSLATVCVAVVVSVSKHP